MDWTRRYTREQLSAYHEATAIVVGPAPYEERKRRLATHMATHQETEWNESYMATLDRIEDARRHLTTSQLAPGRPLTPWSEDGPSLPRLVRDYEGRYAGQN